MTPLIPCHIHDHFELLCMRRSQVVLHLIGGGKVAGKAIDLRSREGQEFLVLETRREQSPIDLTSIKAIEIIQENRVIDLQWLILNSSSMKNGLFCQ